MNLLIDVTYLMGYPLSAKWKPLTIEVLGSFGGKKVLFCNF